ncbi:hypothetical protein FGRMN_6422 [Fusarium graminum]|nr:hypothetical protein FGRMN_6422 [Fusarium graminum]
MRQAQMRSLGGDPVSDRPEKIRGSSVAANSAASGSNAETPIIVREEGRPIYHESEGWHNWIDVSRLYKGAKPHFNASNPRGSALSPGKFLPHAFQGSPWLDRRLSSEGSNICPIPTEESVKLWNIFMERVEPLVKFSFKWTLDHLRAALSDAEKWARLDYGDQSLILASCLFASVSLTKQESVSIFGRAKESLISECRLYCDMAFSRISLLAIDNISTLKAFCLYMKANVDILTARSLWSLMGLVTRNAEQLGFHRDGTVLGLSPVETEERRRLWWQLQHVDLVLSLKNGVTPLSFSAAWDVKLPLNIEDSDIDPTSQIAPKERTGLTSFSFTLFNYWSIEKQRGFRMSPPNQPVVENSLLGCLDSTIIDDFEKNIITCSYQSLVVEKNTCTPDAAMKYIVISHSNPQLKPFAWLIEFSFVWHAFIGILVDLPNLADVNLMRSAWILLAELYAVADHLSDISDDKRNAQAAKSVVATWYECRQKPALRDMPKPDFVSKLERRLLELEGSFAGDANGNAGQIDLQNVWQTRAGEDDLQPFGFEFTDIDWAFWDSID